LLLTVEAEDQRGRSASADARTVESLNDVLVAAFTNGQRMSVTWLNHFSAPHAMDTAAEDLSGFDVVGIDGKLLQLLIGGRSRTSADLAIPALLPRLEGARVAIVGGARETERARADAMGRLLDPGCSVVLSCDGYGGLPGLGEFRRRLQERRANVVIVGLGAGLQERYARAAREVLSEGGLALTCGGFLDQLLIENYYPSWAYPLRLNWLIRLAREPRRLWRRYTVDAVAAVSRRTQLARAIGLLPGLWM
jgi:exopolysaccharide biosynthesis WecB/TagA/CpsF family protein